MRGLQPPLPPDRIMPRTGALHIKPHNATDGGVKLRCYNASLQGVMLPTTGQHGEGCNAMLRGVRQ